MKYSFLTKLIFLLTLSSCASVSYHEPVEMSQAEVAEIKLKDSHGRETSLGARQFNDCYYQKMGLSKNCSQVICKEDKSKETGLNCLIYYPQDMPVGK